MKGPLTHRVREALKSGEFTKDDDSMTMRVTSALLRIDPQEAATVQDDQQFAAFVIHPDLHRGVASRRIRYLLSFRSIVELFLAGAPLVGSPSDLEKAVAAIGLWKQIGRCMSVKLDDIGALIVWAVWAHGYAKKKILLVDVIRVVNTEAKRAGLKEVAREQAWGALKSLEQMKCVGCDSEGWYLRDRVELVI